MAIRHARNRVTAVLAALGLAAGLAASAAAPAAAAEPRISKYRVVVPMIFPVVRGASYSDTYLACRSGCDRRHLGQDLMAPKLRPLVAAFDGTLTYVKRERRVGEGNYFSLTGTTGWTVNYIHANNDSPGTDDGRGTKSWFLMPGLGVGSRVFAGQQLGWSGDSGNAEGTSPHTHFELRKGDAWSGTVYNPYASLRAAKVLRTPYISGPHPEGSLVTAPTLGTSVWAIRDGRRLRVPLATLAVYGWTRSHAIRITANELRFYPSGGWLPLPDGVVARGPDDATWAIVNGERVAVPQGTDLATLGTTTARVAVVDAASITRRPLAADQTLPGVVRPGALLRDNETSATWYVEGAVRRLVPDAATMRSWGWTAEETASVSPEVIADIPVGPVLGLRDGTVFTTPGGWWFVVSDGQRRRVSRALVLKAYGWDRLPRIEASVATAMLLPSGPALP